MAGEETLAAKIVITYEGKFVCARVYVAQCDESVSGENGNPKYIAAAQGAVIENAVPKALEEAAKILRLKPAFYQTEIV